MVPYIASSNSQILAYVAKMTFLGNRASAFGGALSFTTVTPQKQTDVVISANFTNNTAGMCGGAGDVDGEWYCLHRHFSQRKIRFCFLHNW